jgi:hypothetical protein
LWQASTQLALPAVRVLSDGTHLTVLITPTFRERPAQGPPNPLDEIATTLISYLGGPNWPYPGTKAIGPGLAFL